MIHFKVGSNRGLGDGGSAEKHFQEMQGIQLRQPRR